MPPDEVQQIVDALKARYPEPWFCKHDAEQFNATFYASVLVRVLEDLGAQPKTIVAFAKSFAELLAAVLAIPIPAPRQHAAGEDAEQVRLDSNWLDYLATYHFQDTATVGMHRIANTLRTQQARNDALMQSHDWHYCGPTRTIRTHPALFCSLCVHGTSEDFKPLELIQSQAARLDAEDKPIPIEELIVGEEYLCWWPTQNRYVTAYWKRWGDVDSSGWFILTFIRGGNAYSTYPQDTFVPRLKLTRPSFAGTQK